MSMEGRVKVLEGRSVSEIKRLNSYYFQAAATLEYDGAVAQDLARSVFPGRSRASMRLRLLSWRSLKQMIVLQDWARPMTRWCLRSARNFSATAETDL